MGKRNIGKPGQIYAQLDEQNRGYMDPLDLPQIKGLVKRLDKIIQENNRNKQIVDNTLDLLGVKAGNSFNDSIFALCETLLKSRILQDNIDYVALQSLDGYITNSSKIEHIVKAENVPENINNQCWQVVNGNLVLDKNKMYEMEEL